MAKQMIKDLVEGQEVNTYFLVSRKMLIQKKNSDEDFLRMTLSDKSGEINSVMWGGFEGVVSAFNQGDFLFVKGTVQRYQANLQIKCHYIRKAKQEEIDTSDFRSTSRRNMEEMRSQLLAFSDQIQSRHFSELVDRFFEDEVFMAQFLTTPAGRSMHHDYESGLLEHTVDVTSICEFCCRVYPALNRDLLLAAALLHDIGKIEELSYNVTCQYTTSGRLIGHVSLSMLMIDKVIKEIEDFPEDDRCALQHAILAQHGLIEFGSPKQPMTPEAMVLSYADGLDSKVASILKWISEKPDPEVPGWTHFWPNGGTYVYMGKPKADEQDGDESSEESQS